MGRKKLSDAEREKRKKEINKRYQEKLKEKVCQRDKKALKTKTKILKNRREYQKKQRAEEN